MKNKFDLIYENIMNQLKKAEVDYQLVQDFKQKAEQRLKDATQQNLAVLVKGIKKTIKWDDPSKEDKINQLKKLCSEKFKNQLIQKIF